MKNNNAKHILENANYDYIPLITYANTDMDKSKIYEENRGKSGVYRWNNLITNKSYVGSSLSLSNRFSIYYSLKAMGKKLSSRSSAIYSALLKYGHSNFSLNILEYCEPNMLISREQYYIDSLNPEYNILKVAGNRQGYKHSEKTKIKIGKKHEGINNHNYGKTLSYETRKKIGESLKGIIRPNNKFRVIKLETRVKLSLRSHGIPVQVFNESNSLIKKFPSMASAASYFGVSGKTISRYLDKNRSYGNYVFKSNIKDN